VAETAELARRFQLRVESKMTKASYPAPRDSFSFGRFKTRFVHACRLVAIVGTHHRNVNLPAAITFLHRPQNFFANKHPVRKIFSNKFFSWLFLLTLSSFVYILFKTPAKSGTGAESVPANRTDCLFRLNYCTRPTICSTSSKSKIAICNPVFFPHALVVVSKAESFASNLGGRG
jgi:hypothetical protein